MTVSKNIQVMAFLWQERARAGQREGEDEAQEKKKKRRDEVKGRRLVI